MSLLLGQGFLPRQPEPEPDPADRYAELAAAVAASLDRVQAAIQALPAPQVHVDEPDLSAIVTAVNGLKPSVDAADIGAAIRDALNAPQQPSETDTALGKVLTDLGEKLGLLEFRLKGVGMATAPLLLPNDPTRLLGHVTVDSAPAVAGTVTASQGSAPWTQQLVDGTTPAQKAAVSAAGALKVDGSAVTQPVSATSLPLPTGAAQDATLTGGSQISQLKTAAKGTTAAGQPTSVATDVNTQALHANVVNFPATQPVSGSVTANVGTTNGLALDATLTGGTQKSKLVDTGGTNVAAVSAAGALKVDGSAVTQPVSGTVNPSRPATGTNTSVASSATSVTVLASNANRLGGTVYNDSTQILYLLLGATAASTTNYSVQMVAGSYYEIPFGFTGQLTGIWASANGNARVTELTA